MKRSAIGILWLLVTSLSAWSADDVSSILEKPIHGYLQIAFSTNHQTLEKFEPSGSSANMQDQYTATIECEDLDTGVCLDNLKTLEFSVRNFGVNVLNNQGPIHYFMGSSEALAKQIEQAKQKYALDFSDTSYPPCEVFVKTSGSTIKESTVIVADDQPILAQEACWSILTARALGLRPYGDKKFSERWGDDENSLKTLDEGGIPQAVTAVANRLYIHRCTQLLPGMNSDQVRKTVSDPNGCLKWWVDHHQ